MYLESKISIFYEYAGAVINKKISYSMVIVDFVLLLVNFMLFCFFSVSLTLLNITGKVGFAYYIIFI